MSTPLTPSLFYSLSKLQCLSPSPFLDLSSAPVKGRKSRATSGAKHVGGGSGVLATRPGIDRGRETDGFESKPRGRGK